MLRNLAALAAIAAIISTAQASDKKAKPEIPSFSRVDVASGLVLDPTNPTIIAGVAKSAGVLTRDWHKVTFEGTFTGLQPDAAYSAWWLIYNKPDNCDNSPCDLITDLFIKGIGQGYYAGGFITDANGYAQFSAATSRSKGLPSGVGTFGDVPEGVFPLPVDPSSEVGLKRPLSADVRLVVRYHGAADPAIIAKQIGDYLGGCGSLGEGCYDDQVVIFLPK